jgi:dipeptidyl aminopeptidase/acylaminoacyl peptidase
MILILGIKLTNSLNPEIQESDLVAGKVVRYKSFDGLNSALFQTPPANANNKAAAIVFVHGGPGGRQVYIIFHLLNISLIMDMQY